MYDYHYEIVCLNIFLNCKLISPCIILANFGGKMSFKHTYKYAAIVKSVHLFSARVWNGLNDVNISILFM